MTQITQEELHALTTRIIDSGVLGRSKTYGAILRYLVECSLKGDTPKEAAIAVDVLGREADFDVSKDSIVRVHIYHLRNKMGTYFSRQGKDEKYRIEIPKGQYIINTHLNADYQERVGAPTSAADSKDGQGLSWKLGLSALALLLLLLNVLPRDQNLAPVATAGPAVAGMEPWHSFLDDELPILLVIGDYFIFGETDADGNVVRMVREFDINSAAELSRFQASNPQAGRKYYNLDLSYIPVSIAETMARIMPALDAKANRISVKMMSDLNTADLAGNHIIYLGYLSAADTLLDLMFADSGLSIGATYDELINLESNEYYVGSSALSGSESFQDFGMVSTFPAPNGNHYLLIGGMRDEGLINIARQLTEAQSLAALAANFDADHANSFEALYEVFGFDYTNFGGELVYSRALDKQVVWETRLINQ